jgi:hypothetical protein
MVLGAKGHATAAFRFKHNDKWCVLMTSGHCEPGLSAETGRRHSVPATIGPLVYTWRAVRISVCCVTVLGLKNFSHTSRAISFENGLHEKTSR